MTDKWEVGTGEQRKLSHQFLQKLTFHWEENISDLSGWGWKINTLEQKENTTWCYSVFVGLHTTLLLLLILLALSSSKNETQKGFISSTHDPRNPNKQLWNCQEPHPINAGTTVCMALNGSHGTPWTCLALPLSNSPISLWLKGKA